MAFVKGQSGNPKGKPPGTLNATTANARDIAGGVLTPDVFKLWRKQALAGTLDSGIVKQLLLYLWGRPRYEVAVVATDESIPLRTLLGRMTKDERETVYGAMERALDPTTPPEDEMSRRYRESVAAGNPQR